MCAIGHGFRCYDNVHVCKLVALYTANAYSAELEMSASACTRSMAGYSKALTVGNAEDLLYVYGRCLMSMGRSNKQSEMQLYFMNGETDWQRATLHPCSRALLMPIFLYGPLTFQTLRPLTRDLIRHTRSTGLDVRTRRCANFRNIM